MHFKIVLFRQPHAKLLFLEPTPAAGEGILKPSISRPRVHLVTVLQKLWQMVGYQLSTAFAAIEAKNSANESACKWVERAVINYYEVCKDPEWCETQCTAWLASAIARLFVALTDEPFWEDDQVSKDTGMAILCIASKMNSRDTEIRMETLSDTHDHDIIRKQEALVLNTLQWKIVVKTPHYFLHHHKRDFGISSDGCNLVDDMLYRCAMNTDLCLQFKTGSLVVACLVLLKTKARIDGISASLHTITTMACVTDERLQKDVCFQEIGEALEILVKDRKIKELFRKRASTPLTVTECKRTEKRPRIRTRPGPDPMPPNDDAAKFPRQSYHTPY